MPNTDLEITQKAMEDFIKIQRHMLIARKENAVETYESLKKEYLYLKRRDKDVQCHIREV